MRKITIIGVLYTLIALNDVLVAADEYLKEKPSFLTPCHLHNPAADKQRCFAVAFENLFTNWKDGIPGLTGLSSIDPFRVKKLRLSQNTPNLADVQIEMRNTVAYGMSKIRVVNSSVSEDNYTFRFHLHLPSLKIEGDYKLKGRLLFLNLDGNGKQHAKINDLDLSITAKTKLKEIDGQYFFDIVSISSKVLKIGNFHIDFTNLFNGNAALEESARTLFNESWREVFEVLRPAITQTLDAVIMDRYKRIFGYVPARFFIEDLP